MKISGSVIIMALIWLLGFTHFLGGPFLFFKVIFWIAILPYLISLFTIILVLWKARKLFKVSKKESQGTLHVEAEIKE